MTPPDGRARRTGREAAIGWLSPLATLVGLGIPVLTVGAFAGLVPLGQWQADEYETFRQLRDGGLGFLLRRFEEWSPRPLSEILLFLYAGLVDITGRQLVAPVLGLLWAGLLLAVLSPAVFCGERNARRILAGLLLSLGMTALFVSGPKVAELFYWVQGAIAYIPTLAAVAFLAVLTAFSAEAEDRRTAVATGLGLCVATAASEMGTFFVLLFAGGMLALLPVLRWRTRAPPLLRMRDLQYGAPLVLALGILAFMLRGRLGSAAEIFGDAEIAHLVSPSLDEAWNRFAGEVFALGAGDDYTDAELTWGIASKAALGVATLIVFRALPERGGGVWRLKLLVLFGATAGAAFVSLFGAFYQFGTVCCERHESMRECLAVVAIVLLARLLALASRPPQRTDEARRIPLAVPAMLVGAAVLVADLWSFEPLAQEYTYFSASRHASAANWRSGLSPGPGMIFIVKPSGDVVTSGGWPLGFYTQGMNGLPDNVDSILRYFNKDEAEFVRP